MFWLILNWVYYILYSSSLLEITKHPSVLWDENDQFSIILQMIGLKTIIYLLQLICWHSHVDQLNTN